MKQFFDGGLGLILFIQPNICISILRILAFIIHNPTVCIQKRTQYLSEGGWWGARAIGWRYSVSASYYIWALRFGTLFIAVSRFQIRYSIHNNPQIPKKAITPLPYENRHKVHILASKMLRVLVDFLYVAELFQLQTNECFAAQNILLTVRTYPDIYFSLLVIPTELT